jgi:hypothetical protein
MAMTFDAEALPSLRTIASVLGGVVSGRSVLAPGPDHHSPQDRSLSVTPDAKAPGGFLVHSFAGDDELRCKDYVREKLAMPAFKPARERERVQQPKKPISTTRMRPAVPCLVRYGCNMPTARRKFGKRRLQKVAQPKRKMAAPAVVSEAKKFQQASADAIARATGAQ